MDTSDRSPIIHKPSRKIFEKPLKIINAIAPIRINDFGGWTDTWFAKEGTILNIAVYPCAEI